MENFIIILCLLFLLACMLLTRKITMLNKEIAQIKKQLNNYCQTENSSKDNIEAHNYFAQHCRPIFIGQKVPFHFFDSELNVSCGNGLPFSKPDNLEFDLQYHNISGTVCTNGYRLQYSHCTKSADGKSYTAYFVPYHGIIPGFLVCYAAATSETLHLSHPQLGRLNIKAPKDVPLQKGDIISLFQQIQKTSSGNIIITMNITE